MTKLEEVARAIEAKSGYVISQHHAKALARTVLEVVREPNEAQYNALCATNKLWRDLSSFDVWRVFVDAILNEPEK